MIVPMKKVSIIMLNRDKLEALTKLRKLGLVHLETVTGNSEKLSSLKEAQANAIQALSVLSEIKVKKSKKNVPTLNEDEAKKKCAEIVGLVSEKKSLLERISQDYLELDRFASWGKIDPKDFEYLTSKGINLSLYEIPGDKYQNIPDSVQTILVGKGKKSTRFLLLASDENAKESLPQEAFEVTLPAKSSDGFVEEIKNDKARIVKIDEELAQNVCYISSIKELQKSLDKEVEFENVYSGMNVTDDGKETDLAWISGFVPCDGLASFQELAKENNWAITSGDIETEDDPPTKLKNNKLVSLIYPLTDFLGTVPGYREFDISGWFLLFFAIFFGMIFGDAGYGLIMFVAAIILIIKSKAQGKSSPMLGLLVLLSLSTVAWGTITCTWFGLSVDQIPDVLKNLSLPPLSSAFKDRYDGVQSLLTTDQNLQIFCFSLALVQLTIAHFKCFFSNIRSPKCIADFGNLLMLWGLFYIVLMLVISGSIFSLDKIVEVYGVSIPIGLVSVGMIGAGFVMSFVFANYDGSIGASILESCKNIISVVLGVVNVFSDIVSYIRLWAVALAGSAISGTVNGMAGPLLGHAILFVVAVVLLVFGHGLNIVLNVLSVIVHGVRLNTLEFSNHLGMTWSGYKYEPFKEAAQN